MSVDSKHAPSISEVTRPEVNYTQGMYCEIVIPDLASKSAPKVHTKGVPMRRSQCECQLCVCSVVVLRTYSGVPNVLC